MIFSNPFFVLAVFITLAMTLHAAVPLTMSLLYSMEVLLGECFSLGLVPTGQERIVIPIVGGTFKGPRVSGIFTPSKGKVLNLGANWRLTDAHGKIRPDARDNIQIDDGTMVYVQTEGPTLSDGHSLLRAKFETSTNGIYAWLNDVVAVGVLTRNGTGKVLIDMWQASPGS